MTPNRQQRFLDSLDLVTFTTNSSFENLRVRFDGDRMFNLVSLTSVRSTTKEIVLVRLELPTNTLSWGVRQTSEHKLRELK